MYFHIHPAEPGGVPIPRHEESSSEYVTFPALGFAVSKNEIVAPVGGPGGAPLNFTAVNGFDIPSEVRTVVSGTPVTEGAAFAALSVNGSARLYSIDLVTGAATDLGTIGAG